MYTICNKCDYNSNNIVKMYNIIQNKTINGIKNTMKTGKLST